jgi:hypothetical protein
MHRVELKAFSIRFHIISQIVPNAPCGVERAFEVCYREGGLWFLMHRVELKELLRSAIEKVGFGS